MKTKEQLYESFNSWCERMGFEVNDDLKTPSCARLIHGFDDKYFLQISYVIVERSLALIHQKREVIISHPAGHGPFSTDDLAGWMDTDDGRSSLMDSSSIIIN